MSKRKSGKQKSAGGNGKSPATSASSSKIRGNGGPMDVGLLEALVRLMSANDLNTVDVRDGDQRVVLKRGANVVQYASQPMMPMAAPSGSNASPASQPPAGAAGTSSTASGGASAEDAKLVPIKSPMVGTFYAAPKQGEKPYVGVGSVVNEETDVCIIEAMKVFNVIKAETGGTIAKVMIQDGQPVEHGTVLFLVKP